MIPINKQANCVSTKIVFFSNNTKIIKNLFYFKLQNITICTQTYYTISQYAYKHYTFRHITINKQEETITKYALQPIWQKE